jgi:hypothetical protein
MEPLDGNALAGTLQEIFGTDMTIAQRACGGCTQVSAVAELRLYQGAGAVLRCPRCADVAVRVVSSGERHVVQLTGAWTFVR